MSKNSVHAYIYPGAEVATDIATSFGHFVFTLPHRFARLLVVWQKRSEQRRHLKTMDKRLLKDVGMTQADVRHETAKGFWQE